LLFIARDRSIDGKCGVAPGRGVRIR